jgi:hypothetical protein
MPSIDTDTTPAPLRDHDLRYPVRQIQCPDGTQYLIWLDGSWVQSTWDGLHVRTDADQPESAITPEDVIKKFELVSA